MRISSNKTGFTLLEILVVVSIIAIMTAVGYQGLNSNRDNAADKALMVEFEQVQVALELYKAQNDTKSYPLAETTGACGSGLAIRTSTDSTCALDYAIGLTPNFIAELPSFESSANPNCEIIYRTSANGSWYKLTAENCIAGGVDMTVDSQNARCPTDCVSCSGAIMDNTYLTSEQYAKSFAVYSNNGECR